MVSWCSPSYHEHSSSDTPLVSELRAHSGGKCARRLDEQNKTAREKGKHCTGSTGRERGLRVELNSLKHPTSSLVWHICCAYGYFRRDAASGGCSSGEFFFPARTIVRRGAVKFGDSTNGARKNSICSRITAHLSAIYRPFRMNS